MFTDLPELTYKRLPALLADALPDDFGNALIDAWMAGKGGGARAKATIAWNPETNEIRAGQFDADAGFEHWLLKFDGMGADHELGTSHDYGRIEYAYSLMARAAGIDMAPCRAGRSFPAHGLQCHGRQLRRPQQERCLSASRWHSAMAALACFRHHPRL